MTDERLREAAARVLAAFDAEDRAVTESHAPWGALASESSASLRALRAVLAATPEPPTLDVELLARAINAVPRCFLSLDGDEHHVHQSDAEFLTAEYARLTRESSLTHPEV